MWPFKKKAIIAQEPKPQFKRNERGLVLVLAEAMLTKYYHDKDVPPLEGACPGLIDGPYITMELITNLMLGKVKNPSMVADTRRVITISSIVGRWWIPEHCMLIDDRTKQLYDYFCKTQFTVYPLPVTIYDLSTTVPDLVKNVASIQGDEKTMKKYEKILQSVGSALMRANNNKLYPSPERFFKSIWISDRFMREKTTEEDILSLATAFAIMNNLPIPASYTRYTALLGAILFDETLVYGLLSPEEFRSVIKPKLKIVK